MSGLSKIASLAVVCPGQGVITRGCLSGFRQHRQVFQHTLDYVDDVFGSKVSEILLQNPPKDVDAWSLSTANAQPAIVASTYAIVQVLREIHGVDLMSDRRVSFYLGHSLGEYTALLLSGVLGLSEAVHLVRQRGLLMEKLVKEKVYEMRVLMFRPSSYTEVYGTALARNVLACANNPSQISISGDPKVLDAFVEELNTPKKTVLKQVRLPVKVPFHNSMLSAIEPELFKLVPSRKAPSKPIVSNLTGKVTENDPFQNTVKCNSAPVQWRQSMEFLERGGIEAVVNLGPGNAVDAINSKFNLTNLPMKRVEDMQELIHKLGV